jgi:hypothetical protein
LNTDEQSHAAELERLEQIVHQSIQKAQIELAQIERTGIWRSSHKTFEDYCFEKFGFNPLELNIEQLIRKLG